MSVVAGPRCSLQRVVQTGRGLHAVRLECSVGHILIQISYVCFVPQHEVHGSGAAEAVDLDAKAGR